MCGGVCICRDSALCLDFLILLCSGLFRASAFGQWCGAPSQRQRTGCEGRDFIKKCSDQVPDHKHMGRPEALSRGGGANFECWVYKQQPTNPTRYTFKVYMICSFGNKICKNLLVWAFKLKLVGGGAKLFLWSSLICLIYILITFCLLSYLFLILFQYGRLLLWSIAETL